MLKAHYYALYCMYINRIIELEVLQDVCNLAERFYALYSYIFIQFCHYIEECAASYVYSYFYLTIDCTRLCEKTWT